MRRQSGRAYGVHMTNTSGVEWRPFRVPGGGRPFRASSSDRPVVPCRAGAALSQLLGRLGITADDNCPCRKRAAEMDARGCDWCADNLDAIVGWLRDEAARRGLPFVDAAGRAVVRLAIRNARRQSAP